MEEKTEAVKGEETTVGLTMNYNPFSFISCQEDALVLAGCISHGLDADVTKKSEDLFATARAMLLDACVCLLYRQGGDSMSMQGLVDLLQNDISHNEDQDMPSIKAAYDKIEPELVGDFPRDLLEALVDSVHEDGPTVLRAEDHVVAAGENYVAVTLVLHGIDIIQY